MTITLSQLAKIAGGEAQGDVSKIIRGAAPFEDAGENDITYAGSAKYLKKINETGAGAVIVPLSLSVSDLKTEKSLVMAEKPYVSFARVLQFFYPSARPEPGISDKAEIGKNFKAGRDTHIGPFVAIGKNVTVGDRIIIHPNSVIGDNVVIGDDTRICPNVTILEGCIIGNRVIINAGSVIGSDGFGFAPDGNMYHKIPHTGIVRIDDDVEIGAVNTIDRATFGKTHIGRGVKTDNHVHIGHNVTVGENTVFVAQVGISGSTTIGRNVTFAGQAGVAGHIDIGDRSIIGPQAGIVKSVPEGKIVSGTPEMPHKLWLRVHRVLPTLPEIKKKLAELEKKVNALIGDRGQSE
ncbi:MAG: UDP-3-O-(3-hydroxymyristoyl)glucosamine N-acyltransferase [Desulfobacteraceae bacterium]|nr:UDP-3-O-(3-hydroxymyristoyl)glucosamine N-acyltransferase [Desulfobacteraceae bacterium]